MLTKYQREQLESLFRQAVLLAVNPAGGPAACEACHANVGTEAHHVVTRGREPAPRLKYEPRFALWLCGACHGYAHAESTQFKARLFSVLQRADPEKARCLVLYVLLHDRLKPPDVSWKWQCDYLRRCITRSQRHWADSYSRDEPAALDIDI